MKMVLLDGRNILSRAALHDALCEALSLPQWYGRNLDALYDCLTDIREETQIRLLHPRALEEALDGYARVLCTVFRRAEEENSRLHFSVQEDETSACADGE